MAHKSKSHRHKYPAKFKKKEGKKRMSKDVSKVELTGTVKTEIPEFIKKYEATHVGDEGWNSKNYNVSLLTFIVVTLTAISALLQAYASKESADAAKSAAITARDTLVLDERPWVGLMGNGHLNISIVKDSPIKMQADMQNVGKTPALNERGMGRLSVHPIESPMPNFDDCTQQEASLPVTLMPNATTSIKISTEKPGSAGTAVIVHDADITLLNSEKSQLFFYGCIWYDDTFKNSHRTEYCLQYIPPSRAGGDANTFAACATHNYAD